MIHLLPALCLTLPALAAGPKSSPKAKPNATSSASAQAQLKKLTEECNELKAKLEATTSLQQDLAAAQKSRDATQQELEASRREVDQLKGSFSENQQSADGLLKDLQHAKEEASSAKEEAEKLKKELAEAKTKLTAKAEEGALFAITPEIIPAKPMNLNRVIPRVRKVDTGVVVVNVLVSENGEVLATSLLQGLPGEGEWVQKANEACVEAAKKLVFDPARNSNGKVKVKVWQGVGFLIN